MKKTGIKRLTMLLLTLALLLGSVTLNSLAAGAAEKTPDQYVYTDYGHGYHLVDFLSGYNTLAFGNVTLNNHMMGAVLIEGGFTCTGSGYADGKNLPPSYIKGRIEGGAVYNSRNQDSNPPVYVGSANQVTRSQWGSYAINGVYTGRGGQTPAYVSDSFFNFDEAYQIIRMDAVTMLSRGQKVTPDADGVITVNIGQNVIIESLEGVELINFIGDKSEAVNTTINVTVPGDVYLPMIHFNGSQPQVEEESATGTSIVWNIPNAEFVKLPTMNWIGHVIAPDADVQQESGNYNGCIICRDLDTAAEGHIYRYNTEDTSWDVVFSLEKVWVDGNDADGLRPDYIDVQLYADGEKYGDPVRLYASKGWYHIWNNLPMSTADGRKIVYSAREVNVPAGYTATWDPNAQTLINEHEWETIDIHGVKRWANEVYGTRYRPWFITVHLYGDGELVESKMVSTFVNAYSFTDLPKYKNGREIVYTIQESDVPYYASTLEGYNLTNTYDETSVSITGTKIWDDKNDQDGLRPVSVQIELLADGEVIHTHTTTNQQNWYYEFTNLPSKTPEGEKIIYTIREKTVPEGYTAQVIPDDADPTVIDIKNTHVPATVDVSGSKTWDDNNNQDGKRPSSIEVILLADHIEAARQTVTAASGWKWAFNDMPRYHLGQEIHYTVTDEVTDYTPIPHGMDLTNRHVPEKIDLTGSKTWNDADDQDGLRPESITIRLYDNGTQIAVKTVTEKDGWAWSFTGLDKYREGKEIAYTITEDPVAGYTASIDGMNAENTHEPATVDVSGAKTWLDADDQDGLRPESITVNLLADGVKTDSVTVTEKDGWKWAFTGLAKYSAGQEIVYTVTEEPVDGYTASVSGWNLTNTHEPAEIEVSGVKIWQDGNDQDGLRPETVTIRLLADGTEIDSAVVSASTKWTGRFTGLPRYRNGAEIVYTITEDPVPGYTASIEGYIVTNTHIPETVEVSGSKVWNDNNNAAGVRPASITVRLFKGSTEVGSKTVTEKDGWKWTFTNLPRYEKGVEIVYTVVEDAVPDYHATRDGSVITNTYHSGSVQFFATKMVNGKPATELHAGLFTFQLKDAEGNVLETRKNDVRRATFEHIEYTLSDVGKTFVYTIEETEAPQSYTRDPSVYTVTVTVGQKEDGSLQVDHVITLNGQTVPGIGFHNQYAAEGTLPVTAVKTVNGKTPADDQVFSFAINDAEGNRIAEVQNAGGAITFPGLTFTHEDAGQTHTFYVTETSVSGGGYVCDSSTYELAVQVTDNGDGTLTLTPALRKDGQTVSQIAFANTYAAEGSIVLTAEKTVNGAAPAAGQVFTFELVDAENRVIAEVQNNGGAVTFPALTYDLDDAGRTFAYRIRESHKNAPAGMTLDPRVYDVTVTVADGGSGELTVTSAVTLDGQAAAAVFDNTYAAEGELLLTAEKTLNGAAPDTAFTFELLQGSTLLQSVQNEGGAIAFAPIAYTLQDAGKTYTYTVREAAVTQPGVTGDSRVYTVQVAVTDKGDGTLQLAKTVTLNGSPVTAVRFENTYAAEGELLLTAVKTVNGQTPTAAQSFSFELRDAQDTVLQTVRNAGSAIAFEPIAYTLQDAGKTFTYTVSEADSRITSITVDKTVYTVTVNVTDNGDGTLGVEKTVTCGDQTVQAIAFDNLYEANGEFTLTGVKTVNGKTPAANQRFTFELLNSEGVVIQSVYSSGSSFAFGTIRYELADAGTHRYSIREKNSVIPGMTTDSRVYDVTVTVADAGDGKLSVTPVITCAGQAADAIRFDNTYAAEGEMLLTAEKTLNGAAPDKAFTFELLQGSTVLQSVQNEGGAIAFAPIRYTLQDAGKTYTYTVREAATAHAGVTVDPRVYTVTAAVTDQGNGKLLVTTAVTLNGQAADAIRFENTYAAEGELHITAQKTLNGAVPDKTFTFELLAGETVIQRAVNSGSAVTFAPIRYTLQDAGKTYTYTVREAAAAHAGVTIDPRVYTVTAAVTDAGDGRLQVTKTVTADGQTVDAIVFENTYAANGSIAFSGIKTVNGAAPAADQVFTFELVQNGTVLQSVQNSGGAIAFAPIAYTLQDAGQTYVYTIREAATALGGMTIDPRVYTIHVTVADKGNGELSVTRTISVAGQEVSYIAFDNTYKAAGSVAFTAVKTVNGAAPAPAQVFTFELADENGVVIQRTTNTGGAIAFAPIAYTLQDAGKTFTYTVREQPSSVGGVTADPRVYTAQVTVQDTGSGTLEVSTVYTLNGQSVSGIAFNNTYAAQGELLLTATKTLNGGVPSDTDVFEFVLKDADGNVIENVTNTGSLITFAPIAYTLDDAGKVFTYTVSEKTAATSALATDSRVYTVTVTVADKGDGTLNVSKTLAQDGLAVSAIAFANRELGSLTVTKEAVGGEPDQTFAFTLTLKTPAGATLPGSYPCTGGGLTAIASGGTFTLRSGESLTVTGIPAGTLWTVEEAIDSRFMTFVNGENGRIVTGSISLTESLAEFVNLWRDTDFSITKVWQGHDAGAISLTLYANGVALDPQPRWFREGNVYTCDGLPAYDDKGEVIIYTARETYMNGYMTLYQNLQPWAGVTDAVHDGGTIINREVTDMRVQKLWGGWEPAEGETYPAIVLQLYCNGKLVDLPMPEPDKHGWYIWYNLPTVVDGEDAVYTVMEAPMEGFVPVYAGGGTYAENGDLIINNLIPATGDDTPLLLWLAIALVSAVCLAAVNLRRRRA